MKIDNTNLVNNLIAATTNDAKKPIVEDIDQIRKENPKLDRAIFNTEKSQLFADIARSDELAKKLARGEPLTDEELKFLEKNSPELLEQARNAVKQANALKQQMKMAKTADQARMLALSAAGTAFSMAKYNPQQAMVYLEAINKAIADFNKGDDDDIGEKETVGGVSLASFMAQKGGQAPELTLPDIKAPQPAAPVAPTASVTPTTSVAPTVSAPGSTGVN